MTKINTDKNKKENINKKALSVLAVEELSAEELEMLAKDKKKIKSGAPRKYEVGEADKLEEDIKRYLKERCNISETGMPIDKTLKEPPTMLGLCLFLGITEETVSEWKETRKDLSEPLKKAKNIIKNYNLISLHNPKANTVGTIFNLKTNYGMVETQYVINNNIQSETLEEVEELTEAISLWENKKE